MKILNCHLRGGFGNQILTYLCARALAQEFSADLRVPNWVGSKIFQIEHPTIVERAAHMSSLDNLIADDNGVVDLFDYGQNQKAADLYSRSEVRSWLQWRPEILNLIHQENIATPCVVIHLRRGDYVGNNSQYPLISKDCAIKFLKSLGEDYYNIISDEMPTVCGKFTGDLAWLPDFWKLVNAEIMLRGNSSFSYVAHLLAADSQIVYSPKIEGLVGGIEHDVEWVLGNHSKLADLPGITEMRLRP